MITLSAFMSLGVRLTRTFLSGFQQRAVASFALVNGEKQNMAKNGTERVNVGHV